MAKFKDLAITGELIVGMPEEDRWFTLVKEPFYEKISENKEKLAMPIVLSTGDQGTYYPNRTSARKMATLNKTTDMSKWIGKKYYWGFINKMNVAGTMKDVIYVTDFHPPAEKPK